MEYDPVTQPRGYSKHPSGIEPIQITKHETFLRGNIIKYVMRAPYKYDELEDLKKARQYLDWEIERVEHALTEQKKVIQDGYAQMAQERSQIRQTQ